MAHESRSHRLVVVLASCFAAAASAATLADPSAYASELDALVSRYRGERHVGALARDAKLDGLAREHSRTMTQAHRLSHDGFESRFRRSGYAMCVENVGWNYPTPSDQLAGWKSSPGHDRNLLDPRVKHAGVGVAGDYITFIACR